MPETQPSATLPRDTRVLAIGFHPRALDFGRMPEGVDEQTLTARIEAGNAGLREAGYDVVLCLLEDASPEAAESAVRKHLAEQSFGLAVIGGGVRMLPEHTLTFERLVNVLTETAPGIRLCFNTAPDGTLDAIRRWISE
ncbi:MULTISPECIES: hypothetical protein [unclassified Streptomyces]|uniref:hypothetical protein n=1 Tax=unclassified Streptomyces TaxID=2593676 RepID=UPI0022B6EAAD|nr:MULTISPECIES: hypothetical protein [unclassified Streptomyces]MCZ7414929.1 hypothetical protein [Streptomyces sp. WMMC897]MCZ7431872.1 hypothetical protein [Streptomyces sp. WMMC1477]